MATKKAEVKTSNYARIVPNDFINLFVKLYTNTENFQKLPAIMLWGQPGVGKSQAVREAAKQLGEKLNKKVEITVASLLLMNPIDLRGIPTKDTNKAGELVAKWLTPEIFKMDASDNVINVLFLDEISAAPPSVQASAYQICLDRRVGEHKFPKNCIVIAAGNRITDKAVAYKMPKPLGNRMTHFEMESSVSDWKKWAYTHGIDSRIIAFINFDNNNLCKFDPSTDEVAFATPRSWEMVNSYLSLGGDINEYFNCIAGTVGLGTAQEFRTYIDVYEKLPDFKNIATGKEKSCPKSIQNKPDVMFAISTMIASRMTNLALKVDITDKEKVNNFKAVLTNISKYIQTIEKRDFVTLFGKDLINSMKGDMRKILIANEEFSQILYEISDNFR